MILLYRDYGSSDVEHLYEVLSCFDAVKYIDASQINSNNFYKGSLLVIGGGAALPYSDKLFPQGIKNIQNFVRSGGSYLGICAGAYFGANSYNFEPNSSLQISCDKSKTLALSQNKAYGSLFQIQKQIKLSHLVPHYDGSYASSSIVYLDRIEHKDRKLGFKYVNNECDLLSTDEYYPVYYHGGCYFDDLHAERNALNSSQDMSAIIGGSYGDGKYLLSGVHFETTKCSLLNAVEKDNPYYPKICQMAELLPDFKVSTQNSDTITYQIITSLLTAS